MAVGHEEGTAGEYFVIEFRVAKPIENFIISGF
jgi:hypothetical protein